MPAHGKESRMGLSPPGGMGAAPVLMSSMILSQQGSLDNPSSD